MKLRNGFVSNSSSSSFVIIGKIINNGTSYESLREISKKGELYVKGDYLSDGVDFFQMDEKMLKVWKDKRLSKMITLYQVYKMVEEEGIINRIDVPEEGAMIFSFGIDHHHTETVSDFIESYINNYDR